MTISNETLKKMNKKIGRNFSGSFKTVAVEAKPVPAPIVEPIVEQPLPVNPEPTVAPSVAVSLDSDT